MKQHKHVSNPFACRAFGPNQKAKQKKENFFFSNLSLINFHEYKLVMCL